MIIVEGMDNSGKSTLAKHLAEKFGLEYLHSPSEYRNDSNRMINWAIEKMLERKYMPHKKPAVYDRFSPISDRVYGPVLRGGTPYNDLAIGAIAVKLLKDVPHLIIYCRPSRERILNFGSREQMDGVTTKAIKLLEEYDALIGEMQLEEYDIIIYDYGEPEDYEFVTFQVGLYIKQWEDDKKNLL